MSKKISCFDETLEERLRELLVGRRIVRAERASEEHACLTLDNGVQLHVKSESDPLFWGVIHCVNGYQNEIFDVCVARHITTFTVVYDIFVCGGCDYAAPTRVIYFSGDKEYNSPQFYFQAIAPHER